MRNYRKGDIVLVKCRVEYDQDEADSADDRIYVKPIDGRCGTSFSAYASKVIEYARNWKPGDVVYFKEDTTNPLFPPKPSGDDVPWTVVSTNDCMVWVRNEKNEAGIIAYSLALISEQEHAEILAAREVTERLRAREGGNADG